MFRRGPIALRRSPLIRGLLPRALQLALLVGCFFLLSSTLRVGIVSRSASLSPSLKSLRNGHPAPAIENNPFPSTSSDPRFTEPSSTQYVHADTTVSQPFAPDLGLHASTTPPVPQKSELLIRVTDSVSLRKYRFFRLRDHSTGLWISRPVNTNQEVSPDREKIFQFRYHSGHYEGWSLQGHTRMHLTSEVNDRVTVDRLWARGYEMWFAVFGDRPGSSYQLRGLLSKELKNNKNMSSSGQYLFLVSRRNRKALVSRGDTLWATGDSASLDSILRIEVYAEISDSCAPDAPISDDALNAALVEEGIIHNLTGKVRRKKKVDTSGEKFQSILRANMCWGVIPRFQSSVSYHAYGSRGRYPIFGSPKPPTQLLPPEGATAYDGVLIARRTIANWAMLAGMQPLLLVDKDITADLVSSVNADLRIHDDFRGVVDGPVSISRNFEVHAQYSQPTYRGLFKAAFAAFPDAPAVMYSNMDILYTPLLAHTIHAALEFVEEDRARQMRYFAENGKSASSYSVRGWMIVGQRVNFNVPAEWSPLLNRSWATDMELQFARKGEVFESDAEDYFVVSRDLFDWNDIPDFVVGGVAFDNWIVNKGNELAIEGKAIIIDATKTIVALHQNHGKDVKGSHKHPKSIYNSHLAASHGGTALGHTSDALYATEVDPSGRISVYDKHRLLYK